MMKSVFGLIPALALCPLHGEAQDKKPNIVFILADDLTMFDIGCYGSVDAITPIIDSLAANGMQFNKCYQTAPMCSPTRHSIFTGMYPARTGAYPNHTYAQEGTLSASHYLRDLGYRFALSGKRHILTREIFDFEYLGNENNPQFDLVDAFIADATQKEEPFVLFLTSNEPHTPWDKGDRSPYDPATLTLPPYFADTELTRLNYRDYLAEINYLDGQVKEALELLEKYELSDNTVVIFASEQGNAFPFAKWTCYNAGLGSALVVYWPGMVSPGTTTNALVEYTDLLPTFIDIAGGDPVDNLDGFSFLPILKGEKTTHKSYTYGMHTTRGINQGAEYYPIRSVSDGTYRLILNLAPEMTFRNVVTENSDFFKTWIDSENPADRELAERYMSRPAIEFFNDDEDPYNMVNLADDEQYSEQIDALKSELFRWMEYCGDKGIETELKADQHIRSQQGMQEIIVYTDLHEPVSDGNVEVEVEGYYSFYTENDCKIYVNDKLVIDRIESTNIPIRIGVIGLKPGKHHVDIKEEGSDGVLLSWSGPEMAKTSLLLADEVETELIFYFPFDDDLIDSSVNKYSLVSPVGHKFTEGKFGKSVELNGTNQYLDLDVEGVFNPLGTPFTFCTWIYNTSSVIPTTGIYNENILDQKDGSNDSNSRQYLIGRVTTSGFFFSSFGGGRLITSSDGAFQRNTWMHIAMVFNPYENTVTYYVNGEKDLTHTLNAGSFDNCTGGFRIGAHNNIRNFWTGKIDEAYFFKGMLSQEEITKVMNNNWFISTGIQKQPYSEFIVFPNPTNQTITIKGLQSYRQIDMFDIYGRKVLTVNNTNSLNVEELKPGQYIIKVLDEDDRIHHRSVIVNR